jgi:hypothetical protein
MSATTRSIQVSAPETKGSCTNPTRASSKTHMPWCLYGEITLIAFMRFAVKRDGDMVALYCQAEGDFRGALDQISHLGAVVKDKNDG